MAASDTASAPAKKPRAKRGEGERIERNVYIQFRGVVTDADGNLVPLPDGATVDFEVVASSSDKRKAFDMFLASQKDKGLITKTITL
jgi:hypothetical protein